MRFCIVFFIDFRKVVVFYWVILNVFFIGYMVFESGDFLFVGIKMKIGLVKVVF